MEWIISNAHWILTTLIGVGTTVATFITSRENRKLKKALLQKEVESNSISVVEKNVNLYQQILDDTKKRFEEIIAVHRSDIEALRVENEKLKIIIEESREFIARQEVFLAERQREINRLKNILTQNQIDIDENSGQNQ